MNGYDKVLAMVTEWRREMESTEEGGKLNKILEHLAYLERIKFQPFLPTLYSTKSSASFMDRFHAWLNNPDLSTEDKKDLFQFAEHIAFFSFDDFVALFQHAFSGPITRWSMDQAKIQLSDDDWITKLDEARFQKTWFCPVTDSLLISVFHHVNGITDKNRRPAFRELMFFGDERPEPEKNKILKHIRARRYERLVLLEDFVGSGKQTFDTVKWAVEKLGIPVLFCPIIIGPEGAEKYRKLETEINANGSAQPFCFSPILTLGEDSFVQNLSENVTKLFQRIADLAHKIHDSLEASNASCSEGALGYGTKTSNVRGATAVLFSNTPNNSLPLIWHAAEGRWSPLFPRVTRQPLYE